MDRRTTAIGGRRVLIVGASDKPDRYSYKALKLLVAQGYPVHPVHPRLTEIEGIAVISEVSEIEGIIDTVTLYVNPTIGETLADSLIKVNPKRVIFNPGSGCRGLVLKLEAAGIETVEGCTLVMLQTGQF